MGEATLSVWDPRERRSVNLPVTWERGADVDAKIKIPRRFKPLWSAAVKAIRRDKRRSGSPVRPYANIPITVDVAALTRSATGFYAIAQEIFRGFGWRVEPPFPEIEDDPAPEGAKL